MAHGGYDKRRAAPERKKPPGNRRPKTLAVDVKSKANKASTVSLKNQIRSVGRILRKELPPEVKAAQEKKLVALKEKLEAYNHKVERRQMEMRDKKIKFFERRRIERMLRRLEKQQRSSTDQAQDSDIARQLSELKEDLEYVRFFPKTEKYISLYMGGDETEIIEKRNGLRKQIKENLVATIASGKDVEETSDDGLVDPSDVDDFFAASSSDDEVADDERTDKSAREQASSASGKATSGMSSDEKNQKQVSASDLMPPPGPSKRPFLNLPPLGPSKRPFLNLPPLGPSKRPFSDRPPAGPSKRPFSNPSKPKSRFAAGSSSGKKVYNGGEISTSSNTSNSIGFRNRGPMDSTTGNSGNMSSNSDARKPRRKRRPKKKKQ